MTMILVNGVPGNGIDVLDRGLQYGDGLFETIAVADGVLELWEAHLDRLQAGCQRLGIAPPDVESLRAEVGRVGEATGRSVAKVILTRGTGGRGYRAGGAGPTTRIVYHAPWPDYPEAWTQSGVKVRFCRTRLGINPRLAGIKHLNRLEQVLARSEWEDAETAEGLMCDTEGYVVEGTMSNLFCIHEGQLLTSPVDRAGVAGVMRHTVLDTAVRLGIPTEEIPLTPGMLSQASELFLTNSLIRIWPVRVLEDQVLAPGPLTRRLQQAVTDRIKNR